MRNLFTRLSAAGVGLVDYLKGMVIALRIIIAAFIVGLGIGGFLLGPAALALVVPQQFPPRQFPTPQGHYTRFLVNFNDCVLVANTFSVARGAPPYTPYHLRVSQQVT